MSEPPLLTWEDIAACLLTTLPPAEKTVVVDNETGAVQVTWMFPARYKPELMLKVVNTAVERAADEDTAGTGTGNGK